MNRQPNRLTIPSSSSLPVIEHNLQEKIKNDLYTINGRGYVILNGLVSQTDIASNELELLERLSIICSLFGKPIKVVDRLPLWQPVDVDLGAEPFRANGVGYNSLHIDIVNSTNPPALTALFCKQKDPNGGGHNIVSNLQQAVGNLSPAEIEVLKQSVFQEGQFYGLSEVGMELNPFPILSWRKTHWQVRFSGKLLKNMIAGVFQQSAQRFEEILIANQEEFLLEPGELLLLSQRLVAHGRQPLGNHQEHLLAEQRRMMLQLFLRYKFSFPA